MTSVLTDSRSRWPDSARRGYFFGLLNLIAVAFAALATTHSATTVGLVLAGRTVPLVAFVVLGGARAERLPRTSLIVARDLVRLCAQSADRLPTATSNISAHAGPAIAAVPIPLVGNAWAVGAAREFRPRPSPRSKSTSHGRWPCSASRTS